MRKRAGKREETGGKRGFIEVYIEIEYNRYSFRKLLNKFREKYLCLLSLFRDFKNI